MAARHDTQREASQAEPIHDTDRRMRAAASRCLASYKAVELKAEMVSEDLDEATPAHGIPVTGLSEEDSVVTSISAVLASAKG